MSKWLNFSTAQLLNVVLLCSCAGSHHYHPVPGEGPPTTPRYLEVSSEASVATMHFPAGTYSFNAEDDVGYYYQAPRKVTEHAAGTPIFHDGGIYVNKRDPRRLRGYVYWAGKLTHLGNLSRVKHQFHD